MLLASVLAIGASSFAGCNDADCPSTFSSDEACSSEGLQCFSGASSCDCINGVWSCITDTPIIGHDMARHDLSLPDEGPPVD